MIFENPFTPPAFKPTDSDMKCGFLIVLIFFIYVLSFFIIIIIIIIIGYFLLALAVCVFLGMGLHTWT